MPSRIFWASAGTVQPCSPVSLRSRGGRTRLKLGNLQFVEVGHGEVDVAKYNGGLSAALPGADVLLLFADQSIGRNCIPVLPTHRAEENRTFQISDSGNSFIFNRDASTEAAGCYCSNGTWTVGRSRERLCGYSMPKTGRRLAGSNLRRAGSLCA